jgi:GTP-binding protein
VLLVADGNIKSLNSLRHHYKAENGRHGEGSNKHGRNGKDTIIKVPLGTVIKVDGEVVGDLWEDDETLLIADGGMGGIGNVGFITSTLQRGKEATDGTDGEDKVIELEMKIIANIGLVTEICTIISSSVASGPTRG